MPLEHAQELGALESGAGVSDEEQRQIAREVDATRRSWNRSLAKRLIESAKINVWVAEQQVAYALYLERCTTYPPVKGSSPADDPSSSESVAAL